MISEIFFFINFTLNNLYACANDVFRRPVSGENSGNIAEPLVSHLEK